jgi:hypothetical protein
VRFLVVSSCLYYSFCFDEIRTSSITVQPTRNKSTPEPLATFTRYLNHLNLSINSADLHKPIDTRHLERCMSNVTELLLQTVVEAEARYII